MRGMILLALLLVSCGEGDSGGNDGPAPLPPRGPLPAEWAELDEHFEPELISGNFTGTARNMPVKLALAPGRLFVSVLDGEIRTIATTPPFTETTFASLPVLAGAEQGLLGIALSPGFASNGHVFVLACVDDMGVKQRIVRYTDSGGVGINPTIIVDDLPCFDIHNAGALKFGLDGMLYVTIGDAGDENLSQTDGSRAGRVLRFTEDGGIPPDNPWSAPDEAEWARGLRNTFGLCIHPTGGWLIGTDNGPNADDGLLYLNKGKNFGWGATSPIPGALSGYRMRNWATVIVPTGLVFHTGANLPAGYQDSLFVCGYDEGEIWRLEMFGTPAVNINAEHTFARFTATGTANKPLDVIEGENGSLYVSTFTGVWRVNRR